MAEKLSMSISKGKGSIRHNTREFHAKNVDPERSYLNIEIINEPIKQAYEKIFGEALKEYNDRQKRKDRKIANYYEHIQHSRQEKTFYELIVQLGNKDNKASVNELSTKILSEFVEKCQKKYPNVYIFGAYIHLDEETPHLHLDYIPVAFNQKRGLKTRNSHNLAMKSMGFNDFMDFREDMMSELTEISTKYDIKREIMNNTEKHMSISAYKEQMRLAEKQLEQISVPEATVKKIPIVGEVVSKAEYENIAKENAALKAKIKASEAISEEYVLKYQKIKNKRYVKENEFLEQNNDKLQTENSNLRCNLLNIKIALEERDEEIEELKQTNKALEVQNHKLVYEYNLFSDFLEKSGLKDIYERFRSSNFSETALKICNQIKEAVSQILQTENSIEKTPVADMRKRSIADRVSSAHAKAERQQKTDKIKTPKRSRGGYER